jgi:hypothetical protein
MEPTITQNSSLYLAQRHICKRRTALLGRVRIAARNQPDDVRRLSLRTFVPRFHKDNGR